MIAMTMKSCASDCKFLTRKRVVFYAFSLPAILAATLVYNHSEATVAQSGLINDQPAYLATPTDLGWSADYVAEHKQLANLKPFAGYNPGMDM